MSIKKLRYEQNPQEWMTNISIKKTKIWTISSRMNDKH